MRLCIPNTESAGATVAAHAQRNGPYGGIGGFMIRTALAIGLLFATQALGQTCYSTSIGGTDFISCSNGDRATVNNIGGTSFSSGTVGGESYRSTTSRIGGSSFSSGSVGNNPYRASSTRIGGTTFSSGSVGDTNFRSTTTRIGGSSFTNTSTWP